jgi:predicted RNA-binding protein (TIGR00451 family)
MLIAENIFPFTRYKRSPYSSNTLMDLSTPLFGYYTNVTRLDAFSYLALIRVRFLFTCGLLADPYVLPMVRVDRGAIRFLLAGAPMMCPGLTSAGGYLPPADASLPAGTVVAINAEGKEHAVGVGILKLGTEEIKLVNKDVGVETATYLGDDLWALQIL